MKAKRSKLSIEENNAEIKDPGFNELEFFLMHSITLHSNLKTGVTDFCEKFRTMVQLINSVALLMVLPIFNHSLQVLYDEKKKYDKLRKP